VHIPQPSFASMLFLVFTASFLTIRGVFARRARRAKSVSKADFGDRLLILLVGLGQALLVANWIAGLSGLAATALLMAVRLPREEAMMIEQFGDRYRDYRRRVGAILPRRA